MGSKQASSNANLADQRWRERVPDALSSILSGRIPTCWYPGKAARRLHLPHLALPQAIRVGCVHTYACRTSGQRIDLFGPASMMPCLRQPPKGHCSAFTRPRHTLVGFYPRTAAVYRKVLVCFFSVRLRWVPLLTQQAPTIVDNCVGGCRRAWQACAPCLSHACSLRFENIVSDTSMMTGRPRTALILRPLNQDRGVGWTLRSRCNEDCEARSCNRPLPRVAARI
jgi:hypothetical protein